MKPITITSRIVLWGFIAIIATLVTLAWNQVDLFLDRYDRTEFIKITFLKNEYTSKVCEPVAIEVVVDSQINKEIDVEYRINRIEIVNSEEKRIAVDTEPGTNADEIFVTRKTGLPQTIGSNTYPTVAYSAEQTCNWDPGNYTMTLYYTYIHKVTERNSNTSTKLIILPNE